ncbi:MAG: nucleotidyltransferase domain-containing protein [Caldilinea sp.]|uniref:nucleotidyltransferase domain-containing protein n=1 Tax=Caldilinea sp. TaxID=2293560 RepID=UPI0030A8B5B6
MDDNKTRMSRQERLQSELERCVQLLQDVYHPERIMLFGSLASETAHDLSDIDLIVIKETDQPFWERLFEVYRLLQPNVAIDLFIYTPKEWQEMQTRLFFRKEVLEKSKVLYEASPTRC